MSDVPHIPDPDLPDPDDDEDEEEYTDESVGR